MPLLLLLMPLILLPYITVVGLVQRHYTIYLSQNLSNIVNNVYFIRITIDLILVISHKLHDVPSFFSPRHRGFRIQKKAPDNFYYYLSTDSQIWVIALDRKGQLLVSTSKPR